MGGMNLVSNVVPDIPRIYTALAEWSACITFIYLVPKRFEKGKMLGILAIWGIIQCIFMELTGNVSLIFWIPCMLIAFCLMVGGISILCKIGKREIFYFAMQSFVLAEFIASLFWQMFGYGNALFGLPFWVQFPLLVIVYAGTEHIVWRLTSAHFPKDGRLELTRKDIVAAGIITIAVFAISNISFISTRTPMVANYDFYIKNIRTLVDLGGVAILYAHAMQCSETRMRRELGAVHGVLEAQYQQYKYSRESINLINMKYHDLKHQIAVLRAEEDPEKRSAFLDRMEDEIRRYDLQNKTGNAVLDTLLTSKSLYGNQHQVTITTVADGTLLAHLDVMDIASIFGNALDNALESVLKVTDKEKRLIHVTVSKQKGFCQIGVENYFEGELKESQGKLKSTKRDAKNHGYGLESIRYSVEKYGGAMNYTAENNWFKLKILIPLQE